MTDELDDELDPQQDERRGIRIIAPPSSPDSGMPPATLRGLGAPTPSATPAAPELGSTGDLEARGVASHLAPRPIASPSPLESRTLADQNELSRLETTGSGVSQLGGGSPANGAGIAKPHPVLGGILRGLNAVGTAASGLVPGLHGVLSAIPGTEEHHGQLIRQEKGRIGEDLGEQKEQATIGETGARTDQAEAAAEKDRADAAAAGNKTTKPEPIFDKAGNIVGFNTGTDLLSLKSPDLTPEMRTIADAAKPKTPEAEAPLADKVPQLNQMLASRYQVLNPGQQLPTQYSLPANATQKDYDRVDKALEAEERARGTKAQQDTANEMRRQTAALAQGKEAEHKQEATDKKIAPYQETLDAVAEAREYANAKTGPGDYALLLRVVDATKPKAGFRFTQAEQNLLIGARSIANTADALWLKAAGGQLLTDEQRKQMLDVLGIVEKHAQQKIQEVGGGKSTQAQRFTDNGTTYNIPADQVEAFKKDHPNAK